jgi:hypothetical protein
MKFAAPVHSAMPAARTKPLSHGRGRLSKACQGTVSIIGGFGECTGIQGKMASRCGQPVDPEHELQACTQQFDYQLTAMSATK